MLKTQRRGKSLPLYRKTWDWGNAVLSENKQQ
jgi:hypothetical protein